LRNSKEQMTNELTPLDFKNLSEADQQKVRILALKAKFAEIGVKKYFTHFKFYYPEHKNESARIYRVMNGRESGVDIVEKMEAMLKTLTKAAGK